FCQRTHRIWSTQSDTSAAATGAALLEPPGMTAAPRRREDRHMLNINIDSERDASMRCRVVPASSGGWDVIVENGRSAVSTAHCPDWHRVESVCALMGAWRGTVGKRRPRGHKTARRG